MLKMSIIKALGLPYARTLKLLRSRKFGEGKEFRTLGSSICCKNKEEEISQKSYDTKTEEISSKSSNTKTEEKQPVPKKSYDLYEIEEKNQELIESLKKGNIFYPYKDPYDRATKLMAEELRILGRQCVHKVTNVKIGNLDHVYFPRYTDILIIGNGAMGLMIAYEIRNRFPYGAEVMVLDRNPDFPHSSTNLGQGTLMQQLFTEEEEIKMSQYCAEFLSSYHRNTEVGGHPQFTVPYEPLGGLLLADETNAEKLMKRSKILKSHGVHHRILERQTLEKKFPWLNLDGVLFGSLGLGKEGLFDPWSFLLGLKYKAINLGVQFVTAEVVDVAEKNGSPVRVICRLPDGSYNSVDFARLILATGLETVKIVDLVNKENISSLKLKLPLEERKRYEYCMNNPDGPGMDTPIVVDPDGTYFRREGMGGLYVVGVPSVPSNDDPKNGVYEVFNDKVKPFLKKRIPKFENSEIISGWTDRYDTNMANEVGIIGPHPGDRRIVFANGFAHLGLQYVPAVARGVMEYVMYDSYRTIDFKRFEVDYLYHKQHMEAEQKRSKLLESQEKRNRLLGSQERVSLNE